MPFHSVEERGRKYVALLPDPVLNSAFVLDTRPEFRWLVPSLIDIIAH